MVETINLYNIAEESGVAVDFFPLKENKGIYLEANGKEYIAISDSCSTADEKVVLAHELGHCMTGGGYDPLSGSLMRVRLEKKAERWAIEKLVPLCELKTAIKQGDEAIPDLAERFGVTVCFMSKVFEHYSAKNSA